jgi:MoaA/NifB/PqqE/SkfB family radical SAM enzyme
MLTRMPDSSAPPLGQLPLLTLYLSERCNSRCVTCDYWRFGSADLSLASVARLVPQLQELGTESVLLSGGEPLLNPEWRAIARLLRDAGLKLWLLTSGLSLAKHAPAVAALFDQVTVSLDGTDASTYEAIRGLDAFDNVCAGIAAAVASGVPVGVRVTLQRANFRQLPRFVTLTRELGARQVSFLAVDVANPHAFARKAGPDHSLALQRSDLGEFDALLDALEREHARDFREHFIAESPGRLRHIARYFAAVCGAGEYPPVRCNAPQFSAVIDAHGHVSPCFFIRGPAQASLARAALPELLNQPPLRAQRAAIGAGEAPECRTCVCSLWRPPGAAAVVSMPSFAEAAHV